MLLFLIYSKRELGQTYYFFIYNYFYIISILQVILIKQGSWSSADYSEFNTLKGFISEILNLFEKMSIKNILKFLINSFFLIPIVLFIIFKNNKKIQLLFIPIFIISIVSSFLFFNFNFLNLVSTRILVRGSDVLIGLVFLL